MVGTSTFKIQETQRPGWARLLVTGELDASTAPTFRRRLRALRATNTHVCVDLSQIEFIDSAGARALSDAITRSQEGDWRVEVAPKISPQARHFFDLIPATEFRLGSKAAGGPAPAPLARRAGPARTLGRSALPR